MHRNRSRSFLVAAAAFLLLVGGVCGCGHREKAGSWDTGSPELDSLLNYHDTVTSLDIAGLQSLAADIASRGNALGTPRGKGAAHFVTANTSLLTGDMTRARKEAQEASAALGDEDAPYTHHRILLENVRHDTVPSRRTKDLLGLLGYFHSVPDSLSMVDVLGQLSQIYADAGDDRAVAECCEEMVRFSPSFLPQVREIARFNLLLVRRKETERNPGVRKEYHARLRGLVPMHDVFHISPQLGVLVFSDLYGLERRKEYLDSASRYADAMPFLHGVLKVYAARKLQYFLSVQCADSAALYAGMLRDLATHIDGWSLEGLPEQIEYYANSGDARRLDSVRKEYDNQQAANRALHKRDNVATQSSAQSVRDILAGEEKKGMSARAWGGIAVALLVIIVAGMWVYIKKRQTHRETAGIKAELERAQRRLTVAELKKMEASGEARSGGDGQWESFEALFTEMHPGFASGMRARYPALTQNDLRLCAMLSMEMDTKHIARLLNIKPESVKKHKQRLRGKLGLSPDVEWAAFFAREGNQ